MKAFPREVRPKAPPIKTQGIKTKLIPFIFRSIRWDGGGRWVEPFLGSGTVALNAAVDKVLAADCNPHMINFYRSIYQRKITAKDVREYLEQEGNLLSKLGEDHYYAVRDRFNKQAAALDFLFLSRACFNGVMRFNKKGGFNVPFCRKPDRYRPALITKIVNQVDWASKAMARGDWEFRVQDWKLTLSEVAEGDFVYCDPPYIGRHTDYYSQWSDETAGELAWALKTLKTPFAYSMWSSNKYRENTHIAECFPGFPVALESHFYHVGSSEDLRNEMVEALVVSPDAFVKAKAKPQKGKTEQLGLL